MKLPKSDSFSEGCILRKIEFNSKKQRATALLWTCNFHLGFGGCFCYSMSIRNRETCVFWKKLKTWNFRVVTPSPSFLHSVGSLLFWNPEMGQKKGPQNAQKCDLCFCESRFFTRATFGPFLENKTRVLRNRGASVHAHFLKNDSLPVMTVIQGGHQSETGTVFWWFWTCFHYTNTFWC
jgi:hypothetical protein